MYGNITRSNWFHVFFLFQLVSELVISWFMIWQTTITKATTLLTMIMEWNFSPWQFMLMISGFREICNMLIVNTKFPNCRKIKQLKRNMVYKYKFVLMYNEYNLYFNSFTKEYPLILSSLNLTRTRNLLDFSRKMDWTISTTNL